MAYEIRARSFGEILDMGFRLVRDHFTLLVGISAVVYVPYAVLAALVTSRAGTLGTTGLLITGAISLVLLVVLAPVVAAAITFAVGQVFLGKAVSLSDSLRAGRSLVLPLTGTTLLAGLLITLGFVLLIVPGVYFVLSFMLIWQIGVFEGRFALAGMRRSRELMRGSFLRGFGVLFVSGLIVGVLGGVLQFVFGLIPLLGPIGSGLAQSAGHAYSAAVGVIFYFDIRCRKEAFDLEHLAALVRSEARPLSGPLV